MITSEFKTIIINAESGKYLTQKDDVDIENRVIASTIALGKNDSVDNYKEITEEEAEAIRTAQEEARKEALNK